MPNGGLFFSQIEAFDPIFHQELIKVQCCLRQALCCAHCRSKNNQLTNTERGNVRLMVTRLQWRFGPSANSVQPACGIRYQMFEPYHQFYFGPLIAAVRAAIDWMA